jgi:hypothetical protein
MSHLEQIHDSRQRQVHVGMLQGLDNRCPPKACSKESSVDTAMSSMLSCGGRNNETLFRETDWYWFPKCDNNNNIVLFLVVNLGIAALLPSND